MNIGLGKLMEKYKNPELLQSSVIPWSSPIPSFGNLEESRVATVGLNPSNREFVDISGKELSGVERRFHTLNSLNLNSWSECKSIHHEKILEECNEYFFKNPYDQWFKRLDILISGTNSSFYSKSNQACHLDLIPFATSIKWTSLSTSQKKKLLSLSSDTLGNLLKNSSIQTLVLNGKTVVDHFQTLSNVNFKTQTMPKWTLPRTSGDGVAGISYVGKINELGGIKLNNSIQVLGYNHNIQSSFGVTSEVIGNISKWLKQNA